MYDSLNRLVNSKQGAITYFENGNIKRKPDSSGTLPGSDFTYFGSRPHAVETAWGYTMGYDANGNLISRTKSGETWNFRYAGFDKPRWMAKTVGATTAGSEFLYNANRSRTVQLEFDAMSGGAPSHYVRKRIYALGSTFEINYDNQASSGSPTWALKKVRIYVSGPEGVIGTREFDPAAATGSQEKALVYHHDHLGSIESITAFGSTAAGAYAADGSGKTGRYSEDAWGQRRDPLDWSGPPPASPDDGGPDSLTPRGFTGHEMLDDLGLVHMNGRIYDGLLGRMLSPDLLVEATMDLQSYNRYSYVRNRPLSVVDPTGFFSMNPGSYAYWHSGDLRLNDTREKQEQNRQMMLAGDKGALMGAGAVATLAVSWIYAPALLASPAAMYAAAEATSTAVEIAVGYDGPPIIPGPGDFVRVPVVRGMRTAALSENAIRTGIDDTIKSLKSHADEFKRLNTPDPAIGKIRPDEAAAAADLQPKIGRMDRLSQAEVDAGAKGDFRIVSGPNAGATLDFKFTGMTEGGNKHFAQNFDKFKREITGDLAKTDLVALDYRKLSPENQKLVTEYIKTLDPELQRKVLIMQNQASK